MAPALPARSTLPGPRPTPLLGWRGNALAFRRDPLGYVSKVYQTYGEVAALVHGDPAVVFALGPQAYRQLLDQPALFHSALLVRDAPSADAALLTPQLLDRYGETISELTQPVLERWGIGRLVDAAYVMQRLTMRIALLSVLGLHEQAEVEQAEQTVQRWLNSLFVWPAPRSSSMRRAALSWRRERDAAAVRRLIDAALQQRAQPDARAEGAGALLDVLPRAHDQAETIEQIARLLVVGSELTAAALSWTLLLLSQYPALLAELGDELRAALRGAAPTIADLQNEARLPLLDRVIRESLRLLPPQSMELYQTSAVASLGDYQLPADATVVTSPYLAQRQPEVYFAPHKFRPERWLYVEPSPADFSPFGAVLSRPLYTTLALIEIKLILALLLQRYRLALAPGVRIDRAARLTLLPKNGLPMIIAHVDRPMIKREAHGTIRDIVALG